MIMLKFQIIVNDCVCVETDATGCAWGFTYTEEQAKERVANLAKVGITATYEAIDGNNWVNNWVG